MRLKKLKLLISEEIFKLRKIKRLKEQRMGNNPGLPPLDKRLGDENYLESIITKMRSPSDYIRWYDNTYGKYIQAGANMPTGEQVIANAGTGRGQLNEIPWWSVVGGIFGMITAGIKAWNATQGLCCDNDWWCCTGMVRPPVDPNTSPTATHTMGESINKRKKGCTSCGNKKTKYPGTDY